MSNWKYILIFCALFALPVLALSQSAQEAETLFKNQDYARACEIYNALLKRQPKNPLYLYRAARCEQELGHYATAQELFEQAGTRYELRNFFLGEVYLNQWKTAEALACFEAYKATIDSTHERYALLEEHIAQAQTIQRFSKRIRRVEMLAIDTLPGNRLTEVYNLSDEAGTIKRDKISTVYTTERMDRRYFCVADSDGIRIASQQRLMDHWEEADTLPESVNIGVHNLYPFALTDGTTLFFASDATGGMGGLDIYMTQYNAARGEWMPAENMGYPFNSPADDYLYAVDESTAQGYFATNRATTGDSIVVYTFKAGAITYLRDINTQEQMKLATLDSIIYAEQNEQHGRADNLNIPAHEEHTDSIYLVISDDIVYTGYSQFRNPQARELYKRYQQERLMLLIDEQQLESLRKQYHTSGIPTRQSLTARIPALENEINEKQRELSALLNEIRRMELEQR